MMPANIILSDTPQPKPNPNKPGDLIPVSKIDTYLWKQAHTKASERKEKYDKNMAKAYIIIYHQCSPKLKNDLKASDLFPSIRQNQDVIGLLCLIQGLCCSYDAKIQSVMATVASYKCLFITKKTASTIIPTTASSSPMSRPLKHMVALVLLELSLPF
jgi:hypothetical protein